MNQEQLEHLRHSCAHLLAAAVLELYPNAKRTIGPAIEHGFYYDFDFGDVVLNEADLPKIEQKMREVLKSWERFDREDVSVEQAKEAFKDNEYKLELIEQFSGEGQGLTFYKSGSFSDLCRGGHAEHPSEELKNFKLVTLAGAYWRGDEKNKMLTRIYGIAFPTKEELEAHLTMLEEAKKRDHRKLGKELGLFAFSPLVGPGLPLFTAKGTELRRLLGDFVWHLMKPYGYERVWIPHLAKSDLYKTSGHWDKFSDDIFHVRSKKTDDEFVRKPMNCPHHTQIFACEPRSYRDLPIRMSEITTVYRDENTGQLQGLSRVRSITQDDAHVFCRLKDATVDMEKIYNIVQTFYGAFGFTLKPRLSLHDPKNMKAYLGTEEVWLNSEEALRKIINKNGEKAIEAVGEATFYGPKIDFMAKDAIGREHQVATIQLDMNMPERFDLYCINEKGGQERI